MWNRCFITLISWTVISNMRYTKLYHACAEALFRSQIIFCNSDTREVRFDVLIAVSYSTINCWCVSLCDLIGGQPASCSEKWAVSIFNTHGSKMWRGEDWSITTDVSVGHDTLNMKAASPYLPITRHHIPEDNTLHMTHGLLTCNCFLSVVYSVFFVVLWHRTAMCHCFSSVYFIVHCSRIVLCLLVLYVLLP
jgi:hypothetical protein